jgi:hypothetical protein
MFHRHRSRASSTGTGKTKIYLNDMKLVDIPPNQSLLFLRYKQGRAGSESRKYPIIRNFVIFAEPLIFDYDMPLNPESHHPKPLRLSFRLENGSNSGFTRYGVAELDIMQYLIDRQFEIRVLLSECSYNTYFIAKLQVPEGNPFSSLDSLSFFESSGEGGTVSSAPPSTTRRTSALSGSQSHVSSSSSNSMHLFETAPVKVSREKFDQLEKQVDLMLAGIINADDDRTL